MKIYPEYKDKVTLIPYGLPQILDFEFIPDKKEIQHSFREEENRSVNPGAEESSILKSIVMDEEGYPRVEGDEQGGTVDESYTVRLKDLAPFFEQWVPIPFLRETTHFSENIRAVYEKGPTNWARARVCRLDEERYHVSIAFDMQVEPPPSRTEVEVNEGYTFALSEEDIANQRTFSLASSVLDNGWFINLEWVDGWLNEIWNDFYSPHKKNRLKDDFVGFKLVYVAVYLTYLEFVKKAIKGIKTKAANYPKLPQGAVDPRRAPPVDVDLILDIGNSRTTGLLIETQVQKSTDLNDSYKIQLRDLSRPENIYEEPFETKIEFVEVNFGKGDYSRRSCRKERAFRFPSPVRIGPEASRLASISTCDEGTSGMSSPKRYLWDERNWEPTWRFNSLGSGEDKFVSGLDFDLSDSGLPLCCMDEKRFMESNYCKSERSEMDVPGFQSKFSRSSIMMHLLMELIQQALLTINSPGQRGKRMLPDVPRHLRKIVVTLPAGMPIAEQNIYRRWVDFAVKTFWESMKWGEYYIPQGKLLAGANYLNRPEVAYNWDEATCTQVVFLYNEIMWNYSGDSNLFFEQFGKRFKKYGDKRGIRVATIDMGGGTSDLSISTFTMENEASSTTRLLPHPEIRDGFNIAGDDVLKAIAKEIVVKSIADDIVAKTGNSSALKFLQQIFGKNMIGGSSKDQNLRGQFVRQVIVPTAYALLSYYENKDLTKDESNIRFSLGQIFDTSLADDLPFTPNPEPIPEVDKFFKRNLENYGITDYDYKEALIDVSLDAIDHQIKNIISGPISNMAELISCYDCDALLLTGRPSRWRAFQNLVYSLLPVRSNRIYPMATYKVGPWYPYADAFGNIQDPKTTVVVGAILCTLAQNSLEGFVFDAGKFTMSSTARYIGEMDTEGKLTDEKVWFEADLENKEEQEVSLKNGPIEFSSPIVIGFRQLPVERWTATRAYRMEFASPQRQAEATNRIPYKVSLTLNLKEIEDEKNFREEGQIVIDNIVDCNGEEVSCSGPRAAVKILLRTLRKEEDEGFWLDTGVLY